MVRKTYTYDYLDKVLSVTEGERTYTYDYHVDGQLARANYGRARTPAAPPAGSEDFLWDGLALIKRGDECFVNEPHVGGGNPVASSKGTTYFNDILGTTVGIREGRAPSRPKSPRYSAAALTAFGERMYDGKGDSPASRSLGEGWFTGKPHVAGLGHAFLFRHYRASLGKWQTADPLGYPDGWNALAYCNNGVTGAVDLWGTSNTSVQWEGDAGTGIQHYKDLQDAGGDVELKRELREIRIYDVYTPEIFVRQVYEGGHIYNIYRYNINTIEDYVYYNWAEVSLKSTWERVFAYVGATATVVGGMVLIISASGAVLATSTLAALSTTGSVATSAGLLTLFLESISPEDKVIVSIGFTTESHVVRSVSKYKRVMIE